MVAPLIAALASAAPAIGSIAKGVIGAQGASRASRAQVNAAKSNQQVAYRDYLNNLQLNDPSRYLGYNAMNDISNVFGYQTMPYASANELAANMKGLGYKDVTKMLGQGYSLEDIQGIGRLGTQLGKKAMKRLSKAGLSLDQIQQLQAGIKSTPQPAQTSGPTGLAAFEASPDYQFRRGEGARDIGNSFAARGGAASGNALRALSEFNSGLASGEFNNWFQKRMDLAGIGERATSNTQNAGQNFNSMYSQARSAQGDARASGVLGKAGAYMGMIDGVTAGMNSMMGSPTSSQYGPYRGGYQFPGTPPIAPTTNSSYDSILKKYMPGLE